MTKNNTKKVDVRKQFEAAKLNIGEDIYRRLSAKFTKTGRQQTA